MAARQFGNTKPRDFGLTVRTLLSYMGRHKFLLLAVAVLVTISALANLIGTYMIRPVVNDVAPGGAFSGNSRGALGRGVLRRRLFGIRRKYAVGLYSHSVLQIQMPVLRFLFRFAAGKARWSSMKKPSVHGFLPMGKNTGIRRSARSILAAARRAFSAPGAFAACSVRCAPRSA